jgi:Cu-processing system permease protein
VRGAATIAGYALRESMRRRVFVVVLILTIAFLALYAVGTNAAFDSIDAEAAGAAFDVDDQVLTGSTLLGLAMFTTLFLGCVLAVFLTLGAVRGDAERGLLQPLVVRPLGRTALLGGRFAAAAGVCGAYVAAVYIAAMTITGIAGGWWPDDPVGPGVALIAGVILIAALALLGSIFLSATANGIAVFMAFGAGLAAGLLGQIGDALNVDTLENIARIASWALPFEALYQGGLDSLTSGVTGNTRVIVQLGPFGGAQEAGPALWPWSIAYLALIAGIARAAFARRDL